MPEPQPTQHIEVHHSGPSTGMIIGIVAVVLAIGIAAVMYMGGPGRAPTTPSPAVQSQAQPVAPAAQQPAVPAIQIPREIDVNINQPATQPQGQQPQVPAVPAIPVQLP